MQFSEEGELVYFNESAEEMARSLGKQKVPDILPADVAAAVRECLESGGIQVKRETKINSRTISWAFFPDPRGPLRPLLRLGHHGAAQPRAATPAIAKDAIRGPARRRRGA